MREDLRSGSCLRDPKHVQRSRSRISHGFRSRTHVLYSADFVDAPEEAENEPETHQAECRAERSDRNELYHRAYLSIDWLKG
jgi:hypothetical protein